MDKMRLELEAEGHDVQFVVVNATSATDNQQELIDRASFPLFQDVPEVDAWGLHQGQKDDFYVYDEAGVLARFLPIAEGNTNLSTPEGYETLKTAILEVVAP